MSKFLYQQIALDVLFQMRYDSLHNSNKQPCDSLRAEATRFQIKAGLFCLLLCTVMFSWGLQASLYILVCHSVTPKT